MAPAPASAEETRAVEAEILREAEKLFAHYGFWKTTVGDIARACGMSPGNLYRYYRNKQAIGLAVVAQFFRMSEAAMEAGLTIPGGTAEARIRRMIRTGVGELLREMRQTPRIVELAEFLCSDEEGREVLAAHLDWRRRRVAREIARGIASGELAPGEPEPLAAALMLATKCFWIPTVLATWSDIETVPRELEAVLELCFAGLRAA